MTEAASILTAFDYGTGEVIDRVAGLGQDEYLWEPVPDCWSVRPVEDRFVADFIPEAEPPPFTTIAWRLWHISVDCFDGYSQRVFGTSGSGLPDPEFVGTAEEAVAILSTSIAHFRENMQTLGPDIWQPLGPSWGPHAESTRADLVLHAYRELVHHGAEIGVLRDLYSRR